MVSPAARATDAKNSATSDGGTALRAALEKAGVQFIAEHGGGPGVPLRKGGASRDPATSVEKLNASNDD